ncbi:MAG: hypothetical protein O7D96_03960 [SAR324 cluster bacterium]|nr:hypothetical protein [SAR324 cluster bacterium]
MEFFRICLKTGALLLFAAGLAWGQTDVDIAGDDGAPQSVMTSIPLDGLSLEFSGWVKPIVIMEHRDFGDLGPAPRETFEQVGVRTKLRLEGKLRDRARLYANYLLDYNEVNRTDRQLAEDGNLGRLRQVEAYVDLTTESTRWRIGAQQRNWYEFSGLNDPTDRFNPRDNSVLVYALEDAKIPETGVAWSWFYAANHSTTVTYVPLSGVNKFSPTLGGFYTFLGYGGDDESGESESSNPDANSSNSKYVLEVEGRFGGFTYLFTYVDGLNPRPDMAADDFEIDLEANIDRAVNGRLEYNRYHSPAFDFTYAFSESAIAKLDMVYFETPDSVDSDDPLMQNDWYEYYVGIELHFGRTQADLNAGQKIVPGATETDAIDDFDDPVARRIYFQNALLGQPRETTHVLTFKLQSRFGEAEWLGYKFDVLLNWNVDGEVVRYRIRPEIAFFLAPEDALYFRLRPDFDKSREITTTRYWTELVLQF